MAEDHQTAAGLQPGDLCHHGSNLLPTYRVIWVDGDKVWLRDANTGQDAVVSTGQCHPLGTHLQEISEADADPRLGPTGLTWPDGTPRP